MVPGTPKIWTWGPHGARTARAMVETASSVGKFRGLEAILAIRNIEIKGCKK